METHSSKTQRRSTPGIMAGPPLDGAVTQALFYELALRRHEVEDELGETQANMRPGISCRCQAASKAFGLRFRKLRG